MIKSSRENYRESLDKEWITLYWQSLLYQPHIHFTNRNLTQENHSMQPIVYKWLHLTFYFRLNVRLHRVTSLWRNNNNNKQELSADHTRHWPGVIPLSMDFCPWKTCSEMDTSTCCRSPTCNKKTTTITRWRHEQVLSEEICTSQWPVHLAATLGNKAITVIKVRDKNR